MGAYAVHMPIDATPKTAQGNPNGSELSRAAEISRSGRVVAQQTVVLNLAIIEGVFF
jgi:hypothetical protein